MNRAPVEDDATNYEYFSNEGSDSGDADSAESTKADATDIAEPTVPSDAHRRFREAANANDPEAWRFREAVEAGECRCCEGCPFCVSEGFPFCVQPNSSSDPRASMNQAAAAAPAAAAPSPGYDREGSHRPSMERLSNVTDPGDEPKRLSLLADVSPVQCAGCGNCQ